MAFYKNDRSFTDYVQEEVSITKIYPIMGWSPVEIDADELNLKDINEGIDAIISDINGEIKTLQYRYRDNFYIKYQDATLRYQRPSNSNPDRHLSEFFKIKANFLLYGISNGKKFNDKLHTNTELNKWVVIDLIKLSQKIEQGLVVIDEKLYGKTSKIIDNKLHCPIVYNTDDSSNFVPFDIPILLDLFGNEVVIKQVGYR